MQLPPRIASLLLSFTFAAPLAAAETARTIRVEAGEIDRQESIVHFPLPGTKAGLYHLVATNGQLLPLQVDPNGRATFVEPRLAKGTAKTYRLPLADTPADTKLDPPLVNLKYDSGVVRISYFSHPMLQYQATPGPVPADVPTHFKHGAHLHPVFSPSGKLVTGNHPPDHRWHRGIWFGWTDTEFEGRHPDFWNMGKEKSGALTGEVRFDKLDQSWSGLVHAGFVAQHRFIDHTGGREKDVLRETWELTVFRPFGGEKQFYLFDLTSTQNCASQSPLKLPKYHYGGLGVRGNAAWDPTDNVSMLTSNGDDREKGDSTKGKWVHMGGDVSGKRTGLAVLIHPQNFRFPQPLRLNPKNPQLCIAPSQDGDWEITPGKPYVSRYRFIVADGKPDAAELDRLWNDYAQPVVVTVRE